jgi:hypothetical protein
MAWKVALRGAPVAAFDLTEDDDAWEELAGVYYGDGARPPDAAGALSRRFGGDLAFAKRAVRAFASHRAGLLRDAPSGLSEEEGKRRAEARAESFLAGLVRNRGPRGRRTRRTDAPPPPPPPPPLPPPMPSAPLGGFAAAPVAAADRFLQVVAVARLLAELADAGAELQSAEEARGVLVGGRPLRAVLRRPPPPRAADGGAGPELRLARLILSLLLWRRACLRLSPLQWDAAVEAAFRRVLRTCAMAHDRLVACHRQLRYNGELLGEEELRADLRYVCVASPGQLRALGADYGDAAASAAWPDGLRRGGAAAAPRPPPPAFDVDVFHVAGRTVVLINGTEHFVAGRPPREGLGASLRASLAALLGGAAPPELPRRRRGPEGGEDAGDFFDRAAPRGVLCVDARSTPALLRGASDGGARFVLLGPGDAPFRPVLGRGTPLPGYGQPPGGAPVPPDPTPAVPPWHRAETLNVVAALLRRAAARDGGADVAGLQRAHAALVQALGPPRRRSQAAAVALSVAAPLADPWLERARFLCWLFASSFAHRATAAASSAGRAAPLGLPEPWSALLRSSSSRPPRRGGPRDGAGPGASSSRGAAPRGTRP